MMNSNNYIRKTICDEMFTKYLNKYILFCNIFYCK